MEVKSIPLKKIVIKDNSRGEIKDSELANLISSIRQDGLMQPVGVTKTEKDGEYSLVFGNRRYAAIKGLGYHTIDAVILKCDGDGEDLVKNIVENLQRKGISSFEYGRTLSILQEEYNLSPTELGARLGIGHTKIKMFIDIFKLTPERYRKAVKSIIGGPNSKRGNIPTQLAHKIVSLPKSYPDLTKKDIDSLFKYAKRDSFTHDNLKVIASLLNDGHSFKDAFKLGSTIKTARVNILLTEADDAYLIKMCQKYNISRREALASYVYGEAKTKTLKRVL